MPIQTQTQNTSMCRPKISRRVDVTPRGMFRSQAARTGVARTPRRRAGRILETAVLGSISLFPTSPRGTDFRSAPAVLPPGFGRVAVGPVAPRGGDDFIQSGLQAQPLSIGQKRSDLDAAAPRRQQQVSGPVPDGGLAKLDPCPRCRHFDFGIAGGG